MAPSNNTYIAIDPLWSYNFIGSLKDYVQLDMNLLDNVYAMVCAYIVHRHTFHKTAERLPYNQTMALLSSRSDRMGIPAGMFMYYCDGLFRSMVPSFNLLTQSIQQITPVSNDKGDIIAFVASSRTH